MASSEEANVADLSRRQDCEDFSARLDRDMRWRRAAFSDEKRNLRWKWKTGDNELALALTK